VTRRTLIPGKKNRPYLIRRITIGLGMVSVLICSILGSGILTLQEGVQYAGVSSTPIQTIQTPGGATVSISRPDPGRNYRAGRHCYPGCRHHVATRRRATEDRNAHTCVPGNRDRPSDDHALAESYDSTLPPPRFLASVCRTGGRHHHTARLAPRDNACRHYAGQLPAYGDRLCRTTSLSPSSPGAADSSSHALRAAPPRRLGALHRATRRHAL
jgi:hypothetical protein